MPERMHPHPREQRRSARKPVAIAAQVTDVIQRRTVGRLANLSQGGLLLLSNRPPRPHAICQLRLPLGIEGGPGEPIEAGVQATWTRPAADPANTWVGYRIIAIAPESATILEQWLAAAD